MQSMLNPNRKKLGALSTNYCIKKLVDLATQSGWDHEDARKKFAEGYVCLTCYRTVEKCSSLESLLQTLTHRQHWSMYNHHPWRLGTYNNASA